MQTLASCRRILLVEDHADSANVLAILLGMQGHTVDVARTFADAERVATEKTYDVVFCDIVLPDGTGLDLPPLVRSRSPRTKLIGLTGHGGGGEVNAMVRAGFSVQLLKPIATEVLFDQIS